MTGHEAGPARSRNRWIPIPARRINGDCEILLDRPVAEPHIIVESQLTFLGQTKHGQTWRQALTQCRQSQRSHPAAMTISEIDATHNNRRMYRSDTCERARTYLSHRLSFFVIL
jgi:hypothetical protein